MIPFKHNDKGEPLPFFGIGYPQLKLIELSLITTIKLNPLESIYNYAKKKWNDETPSELNEFETDLVATHIATQAFIIVYNGGVKSINFISLKKHDDHFGIIDTEKKPKYISVKNKQDLDTKCKGLLAGFAAEKVILDNEPSFLYGKSNFNKAFKMLKNFLLKGLEKDNLSNELMFKKEDEALRMIDEYILEMENFVKENEYIIKELILQLKIKEELTGQEIKEIIEREDSYESSLIPTF
jgi:ATP-dependent Zn protease